MKNIRSIVCAVVVAVALLSLTAAASAATVQVTSNATLGTYLVNESGMTLYYFARDIPGNGSSACTSPQCHALWTPFYAGQVNVSPPLNASDFATINTSNGEQTTYQGWPLYFFNNDTQAGDTRGDGFLGIWFVMKPNYSVMIMDNATLGPYLVTGNGTTLYNFSIDSRDMSNCTDSCLTFWPPFYAQSLVVPSSLSPDNFSSFTRPDGAMQTAYQGMPLYTHTADTKPGDTAGQGILKFNGTWSVVPPNATPLA